MWESSLPQEYRSSLTLISVYGSDRFEATRVFLIVGRRGPNPIRRKQLWRIVISARIMIMNKWRDRIHLPRRRRNGWNKEKTENSWWKLQFLWKRWRMEFHRTALHESWIQPNTCCIYRFLFTFNEHRPWQHQQKILAISAIRIQSLWWPWPVTTGISIDYYIDEI